MLLNHNLLTLASGEVKDISVGGEHVDLLNTIDGLAANSLESEFQLTVLSSSRLVGNLLSSSASSLATRSNLELNPFPKYVQRFRT